MNDRELMEQAAKAAGVPIFDWCYNERDSSWHGARADSEEATVYWSPLTNDGDALRLAVKLGMLLDDIRVGFMAGHVVAVCQEHVAYELRDPDPYAATRRAIVRVAAGV